MNHSMSRGRVRRLAAAIVLLLLLPALACASARGTVKVNSLNLRRSASKKATVLMTLKKGSTVTILSKSGDWYKVTYGKTTGYVMKEYISASGTTTDRTTTTGAAGSSTGTVCASSLNMRDRPSTNGKILKRLGNGNKVTILGTSGSWYKVKSGGTTGYVSKAYISRNGKTADGKTTYSTERLNWFNGGSKKIPKGATFQVKDCKTGRIFTCRRWSGASHLDAEPLTASDTKILKKIFGGWSWRRRPVLVKYNGHVYAGSMNGMPHGTQTIKGNNFNGHFCIHFYGSKTHGSKRVDKTHQDCVAAAMKYTW